jgi:hypothetical protein
MQILSIVNVFPATLSARVVQDPYLIIASVATITLFLEQLLTHNRLVSVTVQMDFTKIQMRGCAVHVILNAAHVLVELIKIVAHVVSIRFHLEAQLTLIHVISSALMGFTAQFLMNICVCHVIIPVSFAMVKMENIAENALLDFISLTNRVIHSVRMELGLIM